jgi:hypothetical protein
MFTSSCCSCADLCAKVTYKCMHCNCKLIPLGCVLICMHVLTCFHTCALFITSLNLKQLRQRVGAYRKLVMLLSTEYINSNITLEGTVILVQLIFHNPYDERSRQYNLWASCYGKTSVHLLYTLEKRFPTLEKLNSHKRNQANHCSATIGAFCISV